jgi:hypothetical protein
MVFLQSRMAYLAPNLSALLGAGLAAQLITSAGGIQTLATMPGTERVFTLTWGHFKNDIKIIKLERNNR